jgi:hypothetical protein
MSSFIAVPGAPIASKTCPASAIRVIEVVRVSTISNADIQHSATANPRFIRMVQCTPRANTGNDFIQEIDPFLMFSL